MRDRTFADFMAGALACISVLGVYALLKEADATRYHRRLQSAERWALPPMRRRHQSPEDACRHCTGTGVCGECDPVPCRICRGTGLHPRDAAVVSRLTALWDGAA